MNSKILDTFRHFTRITVDLVSPTL